MTLTLASLFDGIGGFCLAFERAGARVVATVEIDKAAASVGARHFPQAHQFPDVTQVSGDDLRAAGFVPDRGIITAGWPCQDFSVAGRRAGLAGARSGLWWEVVRILADVRPRWFVGENVPGLLSSVCQCPGDLTCELNDRDGECTWDPIANTVKPHDVDGGCCRAGCMENHGGAMGSVLGSLGELGYGVAYRILDAQHFGVPQQRRRVFIVGHLGAPFGAAAQVLLEPESGDGDPATGQPQGSSAAGTAAAGVGAASRDVAPSVTARYGKGAQSAADDALLLDGIEHTHTHNESGVDAAGRRETGTPDRRRIGRGWPPHHREVVGALTTSYCGGIGGPDDNAAQAGYLVVQPTTAQAVNENQRGEVTTADVTAPLSAGGGKPGQGYACVVQPLAIRGREGGAMLEVGPEGGPYNALRAGDGGSSRQSLIAVTGVHLTQDPISSEGRTPCLGSTTGSLGVAIPVDLRNAARSSGSGAGTQGDGHREDGVSYGLSATQRAIPGVATETVVRRLTELECERLQGYPDGWTDGQSGSARYRQLGNSVAVPVVEWIARRLIAIDTEAVVA